MKVAYLVNHYPAPSHAFIRREILGHQEAGMTVCRLSIRRHLGALAELADQNEAKATRVLLDASAGRFLLAILVTLVATPIRFAEAFIAAWRMGRAGARGRIVHLIYLAEACLLRNVLRTEHIDHLHAHFGTNPAAVALLCRMLGGPGYSFTVHGPEEFDHPRELSLDAKIAGARFVVGISEFGRSQLLRWAKPADWDKIHVVHCGVDETFLGIAPTPPPAGPRLVCVGRLCAEKGHAILLQAAARVRARGIPLELVLIGDGPLRLQFEDMTKTLDLTECVQFRGWQSGAAIREELLNARAMVLPSFAEGLPVVLMESLALARPVITTQIAGIPELVRHGENGWLVAPGNVDALAQVMEEALRAPVEKLIEMGKAGARRVHEQHDAAIEAGKLAQLFRKYSTRAVGVVEPAQVSEATEARIGRASV